jgi:protein SCO1/2
MAAVALAVLLAAAGAVAWHATRSEPPGRPHFVEISDDAYVLPKPDALQSFKLVRHDDTPFGNDTLRGRWTFMFFGYTFCPDVCPTTLAVFNDVQRLLAQRPEGARDVQFVFVSVDPERDTTKLLKAYVPQFNPEFVGVTGEPAQIARLADSVGAVYAKVPGTSERHYLMDHSTAVVLINPRGQLQGIFAPPHVPDRVVQGFLKIRAYEG